MATSTRPARSACAAADQRLLAVPQVLQLNSSASDHPGVHHMEVHPPPPPGGGGCLSGADTRCLGHADPIESCAARFPQSRQRVRREPERSASSARCVASSTSLPNMLTTMCAVCPAGCGAPALRVRHQAFGWKQWCVIKSGPGPPPQGELMLRDGPFMSEADLLLRVDGVFVPETGRLHAVAEPRRRLGLPFSAEEAKSSSPTYRCPGR